MPGPGGPGGPRGGFGGPGGPGGFRGPGGPGGFGPPPPHRRGWGWYPHRGCCSGCLFPFILGCSGFIALIVFVIGAIF